MKNKKQTITYSVNGTTLGVNSNVTSNGTGGYINSIPPFNTNVYGPGSGYFQNLGYDQKLNNFDLFNFDKPIESYISVNKSRLKKYSDKIYLNDNDEFEFEFFNPNTSVYGVKIKINGEYISDNKIILDPGKRVYLDRYINTSDKFKFKTYTVEDNNKDVESAIRLNGQISFEFYKEDLKINFNNSFTSTNLNNNNLNHIVQPYTPLDVNIGDINTTFYCAQEGTVDYNNIGTLTTSTFGFSNNKLFDTASLNGIVETKETGRIDKGDKSDMIIDKVNKQFDTIIQFSTNYQLLPISQKPIETKDLIRFCPSSVCGLKSKKDHNFCSKCGTKL